MIASVASKNGVMGSLPSKPSASDLDNIFVIVGGISLVPWVLKAGFTFMEESQLYDELGVWVPESRTKIEAAKRAGRYFVLLTKREDRASRDLICELFKDAKIRVPRTETIDTDRFTHDPLSEVVRCILGISTQDLEGSPAAEARGIGTPLDDLAERYGKLEWVWHGWLAKGLLTLLSGESGAGKTTAATDILLRIFEGAPLPDGSMPPANLQGVKSLYIDADLRASHQLTDLVSKYKLPGCAFDVFEVLDQDGVPRTVSTWEDDPDLFALLEATLKAGKYGCLVVDTISRFAGSCELASPNEISKYAGPLQRIARNLSIPVILLGHSNAMGGAYGRHLVAACQLGWSLTKERELSVSRSYAAPPEPLSFDFTESGPLDWTTKKPSRAKQRTELEGKVLERLENLSELHEEIRDRNNGWSDLFGWAQDNGLVKGTGKSQFKRAMDNLEGQGIVLKIQDESKNGKPFSRYILAKEGKPE